ncbi:hypothetical protein CN204_15660 [Sinorhizobium meliloti]|nr:hypothetical protein C7U62_18735 [Mesorhizobium loti]RVH84002.1 hypothetical protein CN204_15660 [Sinorhizobium meliloti]RVJ00884.1 hypothetical protein CN193_17470 [Sinorhizobium meliloti]RVK75102.1 hypothetical protein CN154_15765 [Sinorhizobium meliloti]RVL30804.1 hypothetical protein CN144_13300 [Sinorhizobium meliloti]
MKPGSLPPSLKAAIPDGNRYAPFLESLWPFAAIPDGKPLRTFPGIALTSRYSRHPRRRWNRS